MRTVFVDTFYWIARINPRDQWHAKARALSSSLKDTHLITTDAVLIELLNYFSDYGPELRKAVALIVRRIADDLTIDVVEAHPWFEEGLELFESRLDKGYSMTDCISMCLMRDIKVTEVLTHDHHFAQEGFVILL
jgi:predicted nucleic acid-binding protein